MHQGIVLNEYEMSYEEHVGKETQRKNRQQLETQMMLPYKMNGTSKQRRWCFKKEEHTKTRNEIYNEDILMFWEEAYNQLDPLNHSHVHNITLPEVCNHYP